MESRRELFNYIHLLASTESKKLNYNILQLPSKKLKVQKDKKWNFESDFSKNRQKTFCLIKKLSISYKNVKVCLPIEYKMAENLD